MTVNAIGGAGSALPASESNWPAILSASAGALGMSKADVSAQLRAGSSLLQIATQSGVADGALTQAIAGALSPSTLAATSSQEREQIATQIAQRPGGAAARYAAPDLAGELASLESDGGVVPLVANAAATYRSSGVAGATAQSGTAVDELA